MIRRHLTVVLALAACCLLSLSATHAQYQRNNQQGFGGFQGGGRSTSIFSGGQGGQTFGGGTQQGGAFRGGQQGQFPGQFGGQLGPGQQQGLQGANPNQGGFVGNDAQDMRNAFENMRGRERRRVMFDLMVDNLNEMRDRRAARDARRRQPEPVRVQLRPTFSAPPLDTQQVAVTLQSNLTQYLEVQGLAAPSIEVDGRTATVSGSVSSDHERAVIERMISLQPGVSQVENLLTVDPAAVSSETSGETAPAESSSAR